MKSLFLLSVLAHAALEFQSRTVGNPIAAGCNAVGLFVPVRPDDVAARQHNWRTYRFFHPDASKVYVSYIMNTSGPHNGMSVLGTRVRALAVNGSTVLSLNQKYSVPFVMHVEGLRRSGSPNDTGFEYQFYKTDDQGNDVPLCGAAGRGTVAEVKSKLDINSGGGTTLTRQRPNVLLTAKGTATGSVIPAGGVAPSWNYPQNGAQNASFGAPNALVTTYKAGETFTPVGQRGLDEMVLTLTSVGQAIELFAPLNLTTPRRLELYASSAGDCSGLGPNPQVWDSGWLSANDIHSSFTLVMGHRFCYRMLDQFQQRIKTQSAWGAVVPHIRENIRPLVSSPIPAVQDWIDHLPQPLFRTTDAWSPKPDAQIKDLVVAAGLPQHLVIRTNANNQREFIPAVSAVGNILIELRPPGTHIWQVRLDDVASTEVDMTANTLNSVVGGVRQHGGGRQIRFRTTYRVSLNQN